MPWKSVRKKISGPMLGKLLYEVLFLALSPVPHH